MDLSSLGDSSSSNKKNRKRVGRGNGSGWGKTSAKGHKGQKARSGAKIRAGFEGGQMPLYRRIPKFGFVSRKRILGVNRYNIVNLSVLDRFDNGAVVDPEALRQIGYGTKNRFQAGIKILGEGDLQKKLTVRAHRVSDGARKKIEAAGGTVEILSLIPEKKETESKQG